MGGVGDHCEPDAGVGRRSACAVVVAQRCCHVDEPSAVVAIGSSPDQSARYVPCDEMEKTRTSFGRPSEQPVEAGEDGPLGGVAAEQHGDVLLGEPERTGAAPWPTPGGVDTAP